MLEAVFSKNAADVLALAQDGEDSIIGSEKSVISKENVTENEPEVLSNIRNLREEQNILKKLDSVSLDGSKEYIFCFSNDLSSGDISCDCLSENRRTYIERFYKIFPHQKEIALKNLEKARKNLEILKKRAAAGETVRIWYSELPYEYCGLCWLITELEKDLDNLPAIKLMFLPNRVKKNNEIRNYRGWGSVKPENISDFLPDEETASRTFIKQVIHIWIELQEKDAPLRAFVNGNIQSVRENFYDFFIQQQIDSAENEFSEAALITAVLGKYRTEIGDLWIASRIEKWIQDGKLTPVTKPKDGEIIYNRILKKNGIE